jgi:DNA polymerase
MCQGRKNTVLRPPVVAGQTADWLIVGEAPDEDEDRQGQSFTGDAGLLLDNMLAALGLQRLVLEGQGGVLSPAPAAPGRSAYLSHAIQCRPPAGHSPQLAEVSVCRAFLEREIALVRPKVIVALGRLAALGHGVDVVDKPHGGGQAIWAEHDLGLGTRGREKLHSFGPMAADRCADDGGHTPRVPEQPRLWSRRDLATT